MAGNLTASDTVSAEWAPEALRQSPFFEPFYPALHAFTDHAFPALDDLNAALSKRPVRVKNGQLLQFVAQEYGDLPFEARYEPRCFLKGEVQTRARNLHDLFNALVWLTYPQAKAAINARHYAALTGKSDSTSQRGVVRDMNTLFDESGVIVACADTSLSALLRGFQWKELFCENRARVNSHMGFYIFGHGLMEKAMRPYTGLTAQGLVLDVKPEFFGLPQALRLERLDGLLADYLDAPPNCKSTRELTPVPLLGIPGWCRENENPAYYDNAAYFRPGRHKTNHADCGR